MTRIKLYVPDVLNAARYSYFVVNRQVVLVDPESREVLEILGGSREKLASAKAAGFFAGAFRPASVLAD